MKKFIYALMIGNLLCHAQSGTVLYEAIPYQMDVSKSKSTINEAVTAEVKDIVNQMNRSNFTATLIFNKDLSYFYIPNDLNENEIEIGAKLNRILMKYHPTYHDNIENINYIVKDNIMIRKEVLTDWIITSESRKIEKFTCYKATKMENFKTRKNENGKTSITAWFCPEIPYSFGPIIYNGLPGLVLELEFQGYKYVARKINLASEHINIELPDKKIISEDEYNKKIKERY